jgi:hypothetical protein
VVNDIEEMVVVVVEGVMVVVVAVIGAAVYMHTTAHILGGHTSRNSTAWLHLIYCCRPFPPPHHE